MNLTNPHILKRGATLLALFSLFFSSSKAFSIKAESPTWMTDLTVETCTDGDTCRLKTQTGQTVKVRLVGIDAPEISKKKGRDRQPMSLESKTLINQWIQGKKVKVRNFGTDMYNRTLGEIIFEKRNINLELVRSGLAEVYRGKTSQKGINIEEYKDAEFEAKTTKKGIWSLTSYESPKSFRKGNKK